MTSAGEETAHVLRDCMIYQKTHTTNLRDVRTLNMWGFELSNIDIISKLQNAETISLSLNKITSLEPFSYCKNLQNLYLRQNCITDLREVDYLCSLPKLTYLMLRDNPISSLPNYRSYIINKLPNLKKLDDIDVTMEDRNPSNNFSQTMNQPIQKSNDRESFSRTNPSYSHQDKICKSKTVGNYHYNNYNDADYSSEDDSSNGTNNYQYQQISDATNDPRRRINTNNRVSNNYNTVNQASSYRSNSNSNSRRIANPSSNYKANFSKKDDSNMLTAVLSLLPELTDDSLQVVLEAIEKQRNC